MDPNTDPNAAAAGTGDNGAAAAAAAAAGAEGDVKVTFGEGWLLGLPQELQNDPTLNQFKTVEDMTRSHVELRRTLGNMVKMPAEDAPPEEWAKFYSRLGRPETPEGYEFSTVEMPPELPVPESLVKSFRKAAHEAGLSKAAADRIYKSYLEDLKVQHTQILEAYNTSVEEQRTVLKGRWKENYETNVAKAQRFFASVASPALQATVEREGWGNHPDFIELFHKLAVATSEDVLLGGNAPKVLSAKERIKEIEKDPAFHDIRNQERRRELVAERNRLYQLVYPESQE